MDKLGTSTFGQKPVETTGDVLVLARGRPCGPFSYIDPAANEYEEERPPPVYLRLEDLNAPRQFGLAAIESDFRIRKTGELKLIVPEPAGPTGMTLVMLPALKVTLSGTRLLRCSCCSGRRRHCHRPRERRAGCRWPTSPDWRGPPGCRSFRWRKPPARAATFRDRQRG